jgi:hypothetical protein
MLEEEKRKVDVWLENYKRQKNQRSMSCKSESFEKVDNPKPEVSP